MWAHILIPLLTSSVMLDSWVELEYLLSTCLVPGTLVGAGDTLVNNRGQRKPWMILTQGAH